ncbi:MAG: PQQ-binding-like beta-propeller repeat protein [Myxococcota bacterium]|nr:PQQ-binding-like beta-propeller repeat protein [Myxococcota bacterium]
MAGSRRRALVVGGMWAVAIGAMALIYWRLEPGGDDGRTRTVDDAPVYRAGEDMVEGPSRAELDVEADAPSPRFYRGGRRNTGRSDLRGPASVRRVWRHFVGGRITAQPVVAPDGTIYVGAHDEQLHAVSPEGEARWTAPAHARIWSAAVVLDDGAVLVGSDADALFAFTPEGETRWRIRLEGDADGPVAVAPDGSLRFAAGNRLHAASVDGEVAWAFEAAGPFLLSSPAIDADGTAYLGSIDDHLYAVAPDGRQRWAYRTEGDVSSSPVLGDDGTIFVGSDDEHVHAVTRDGERRWRTDLDGFVRAPVALGRRGDVVAAVYGPDPRVVSLDAETGEIRWSFPVTRSDSAELGVASGPLVDAEGSVYFGAHDDFVYALSADGALRWIHEVEGDVDSAPILAADGLLLVGSDDGHLYALGEGEPEVDAGAPDAGAPEE